MSSEPAVQVVEYGYDPTLIEPIEITPPQRVAPLLPSSAMVDTKYLPPVGQQRTPNCAAWASTYGLATFTAAQAGDYSPTDPGLQASSAYIYIQVLSGDGEPTNCCTGSQLMSYFKILAGGGTPTMEQAPYVPNCQTLWSDYGDGGLSPDPAFTIAKVAAVSAKTPDDVKQILAAGKALCYGTSLYTDFPGYKGDPVPYVGSGVILMNPKTGKPVGHCMLIIGYDDTVGSGAFFIQNSFGTQWGSNGYVWMAYDTFTALAQGGALYVVE